ncbi:MAG TPA: alpha/beta hydrolase [Gammaproteobacteria bacterium]|nr:alpha/beta hydrolase [Gammaproteobacteria bacterium]
MDNRLCLPCRRLLSLLTVLAGLTAAVPAWAEPMSYNTITVDGVKIFYREAGPKDAPTILLLHGFPTSSRMFQGLMPLLADRYHLIAPDYPGFGMSDAPPSDSFAYTFDRITQVMDDFTQALGLKHYSLYMCDYGGDVGLKLAIAHPERIQALIVQNANISEEGESELWVVRRAYWTDRAAYEGKIQANLSSLDADRGRHVGSSPHPERYNPDAWNDEYAFLSRPGEEQKMLDLFYDYRTNQAAFPAWQAWLKQHQPPTLVVWGKYDTSFTIAGALTYAKALPNAEVHLLNAGHFALDEATPEIAELMRAFLASNVK